MPRKKYVKKRNYSRPGYSSCGKMLASDARQALAIAKSVKRLLNVEIKNHDVQLTGSAITDSATITPLSNLVRGDTTGTRDGSQIKMVGLTLNFTLQQHGSAGATFVRIMIVLDKQTNQLLYNIGDLLQDGTIADNIVSPRNLDNKKRFAVWYDRVFQLNAGGVRTASIKKYFKKEVMFRYDENVGDITDLTQNSLSIVMVATEATNDPNIVLFSRLRYVDN